MTKLIVAFRNFANAPNKVPFCLLPGETDGNKEDPVKVSSLRFLNPYLPEHDQAKTDHVVRLLDTISGRFHGSAGYISRKEPIQHSTCCHIPDDNRNFRTSNFVSIIQFEPTERFEY